VIVVNNSGQEVNSVQVTGPATVNGSAVASGESQDMYPENVPNGQATYGFVFFESAVPAGATFNLTATGTPGGSSYKVDLQVQQANYVPSSGQFSDPSIAGIVKNPATSSLSGPFAVGLFCFDQSGHILSTYQGFASSDADMAPGATNSFQVNLSSLNGTPTCPTYLVGSTGHGSL
jgi:hypothetical protein